MDKGYIYVLINLSMEGLVKIGKTTKEPKNGVTELSGVTEVPTPFQLVYYSCFDDCAKAELYIHTLLEQRGLRVAKNREYFNIPIKEAIDTIIDARNQLDFAVGDNLSADFNMEDDFLSELSINRLRPWEEVWEMAEAYYYGLEESLEDHEEALKLYKQAASLGCPSAFIRLGFMYRNGEGCTSDYGKALDYLKEGARKGESLCYAEMYKLFQECKHAENAQKCWNKFMDNLPLDNLEAIRYCFFYVFDHLRHDQEPMRIEDMRKIKDEILDYGFDIAKRFESKDAQFSRLCQNTTVYIKNMVDCKILKPNF